MADRRLARDFHEPLVIVDVEHGLRRIRHLEDDDRTDLDRIALQVVDLQRLAVEVAYLQRYLLLGGEREHHPKSGLGDRADVAAEERNDLRLVRLYDRHRRDCHEEQQNEQDAERDNPAGRRRLIASGRSAGRCRPPRKPGMRARRRNRSLCHARISFMSNAPRYNFDTIMISLLEVAGIEFRIDPRLRIWRRHRNDFVGRSHQDFYLCLHPFAVCLYWPDSRLGFGIPQRAERLENPIKNGSRDIAEPFDRLPSCRLTFVRIDE